MNLFDRVFYGNSLFDWGIALAIAVVLSLALLVLRNFLARKITAFSRKTDTKLDNYLADILSRTRFLFIFAISLYIGAQYLELTPRLERLVGHLLVIVLLLQAAFWGNRGIALWLNDYIKRRRETDAAGATTISVLGFMMRLALWSLILLMILDNLGVNITALVASLGIGGIAVALAVQNVLGDIFASLSIALDKPFVIGDFIIVGDDLGTVEYIGLKTTRVRSLGGEQIIFSNSDLLNSRVHNYKRMQERRIVFGFGVVYQTSYTQLERIPDMIREIIKEVPKTRIDRVHFKQYGDSSLDFEVVYYVLSPDYNIYMDTQQAINLAIFQRFEQEGIDFAYPTRTLYLERGAADSPSTKS